MRIVGVIPARMESKRFPGKPLAKLGGKEMILHVLERAGEFGGFERLLVATDSVDIRECVERAGGEVYFSDKPFRNGSERVAAAIENIDTDLVANIQGDEVMVDADLISATVTLLERNPEFVVATAAFPLGQEDDAADPNLVKVTFDRDTRQAQMFSRKPIKLGRDYFGHIGVYTYRRDFLLKYRELEQSVGELEESLEQLRIVEAGYPIGVAVVPTARISINTAADLARAEETMMRQEGAKQ